MNERIKQLWEESQQWNGSDDGRGGLKILESVAKFAELIVKECTNVIEGGRFLHEQAPTALFAKECSAAIKRHFGVENESENSGQAS